MSGKYHKPGVEVLASRLGVTLIFKSEADLSLVIKHLQGMKKYKATKAADPYPAVYMISDRRIPTNILRAEIDRVYKAAKAGRA